MAKIKARAFLDKETGMKLFPDIYTQRTPDAGWSVVQAATLLSEGKKKQCDSLIIYAALELRLAIEQLIFTVIAIGKGRKLDDDTLKECRKKDGLFRILEEVSPKYSLRCRFSNALSSFYPGLPQVAEWDVRSFRRYSTDLSELCHSQLIIRDMADDPAAWNTRISLLEEVYHFLEAGMKKGTCVLEIKESEPVVKDLWEKFSSGAIDVEKLKSRYALVKPVLDSRRIYRP
ncbi:MAG: hypothetical protein ABSH11_09625 [Verrucomicrobiota bacterium]|jgi:hypothetical protein